MRTNTSKGYKEIIGKKRNQRHKESLRLYAWVDHFRHWPVAIILIATIYYCVDWCLQLVYQPAGLSSCRSIGMNIVFFNMVLPKIRLSQLLPGAFKSLLKSRTFVQIQGRFHFLLKSHAAMQHHKYIDHLRHWRLWQGRHGLREVQWTAVPLNPDLLRGNQAHLSLWFSPRTAQSRKMVLPVYRRN